MRILALFLTSWFLGLSNIVFAQVNDDYGLPPHIQTRVLGVEADYERMVQTTVPQFKLIREVGVFPRIKGKTVDVPIRINNHELKNVTRPNSPPIIATLHDRRSGKPLDNCQAPCTLQSPAVPPGMLTFYRYGSVPVHQGAEVYAYFDDDREAYIGFNEVDHQIEREHCAREFLVIRELEPSRDAEPCVRIPPMMPPEAERSGHCMMAFNVSKSGDPIDARADACTEQIFCEPSLRAVQRWIYYPKLKYGEVETRTGVESKMSFRLTDEEGLVLPEADDDMQPCVGSA